MFHGMIVTLYNQKLKGSAKVFLLVWFCLFFLFLGVCFFSLKCLCYIQMLTYLRGNQNSRLMLTLFFQYWCIFWKKQDSEGITSCKKNMYSVKCQSSLLCQGFKKPWTVMSVAFILYKGTKAFFQKAFVRRVSFLLQGGDQSKEMYRIQVKIKGN